MTFPIDLPEANIRIMRGAVPPGYAIVYYRGFMGRDRTKAESILRRGEPLPENLRGCMGDAEIALRMYAEGLVDLTQRRLAEGQYLYIAIKRTFIQPPAGFVPPSCWSKPSPYLD